MSDYEPTYQSYQAPAEAFGPAAPPIVPPVAPPAPTTTPPPPPGQVGRSRRTVLTAAAVAAIVGGGVGAGAAVALRQDSPATPASAGLNQSTATAPAAKLDGSISAAAAKIGPSVVTITVTTQTEQDTGSGVIIRQDGYILTNNHVISAATGTGSNGASNGGTIVVTLTDGRTAQAQVIGTDPSDDLAVVKINLTGLTAATFGKSASLVVGQTVVAVGAPLGLSDTVTSGIVSDIGRPVQTR